VSSQEIGSLKLLEFRTDNTKRLSVIMGKFEKNARVDALTPVNIYKSSKTDYADFISPELIKDIVNLMISRFGRLDVKEINLIIREWNKIGGLSNNGFIMMDMVQDLLINDLSHLSKMIINSPVDYSRKIFRDVFAHEFSHQWWGHTIAAASYKDVWIMEGGATFSSLLYFESITPYKKFIKTIEKCIKNWVFRYSDKAPLIYGPRILNLGFHKKVYQSLVYNKAALVFFMLREILGKEPFYKLIQRSFREFKYKMVTTANYIKFLSGDKPLISKFLNNWVYSRKIPSLKVVVNIKNKKAKIQFVQRDTDFVFPLELRIKTKKDVIIKKIVIDRKFQVVDLALDSKIKQIWVKTRFSPVEVELVRKNVD
jgi:aminopeptidase N